MSDDNNLVESSVINGNFGCVQHKQHMLVLMNAVEFNVECMWNTSYAAIINSCTLFNVPSHFYFCCWFLVILFGKFRFAAFNELHLAYFHNKPVFSLACHLNTAKQKDRYGGKRWTTFLSQHLNTVSIIPKIPIHANCIKFEDMWIEWNEMEWIWTWLPYVISCWLRSAHGLIFT